MPKYRRPTGPDPWEFDEVTDTLTERVTALLGDSASRDTDRLVRLMLRHNYGEDIILYAVDGLERLLSVSTRPRTVKQMVHSWVMNNGRDGHDDRFLVSQQQDDLRRLFGAIEKVVHSRDLCGVVDRLISAQYNARVPALGEDLVNLGAVEPIFYDLPRRLRGFVSGIVDDAIAFNSSMPPNQRRRYNNLGRIVESLHGFVNRSCDLAYPLLEKVDRKDRRNILFPFYEYIGRIPEEASRRVYGFVGRILDFLPEDGAMGDPDVRRVEFVLKRVTEAFECHEPWEIDCFLDFYSELIEHSDRWSTFSRVTKLLSYSTMERRDGVPTAQVGKSSDIDTIGLKYLRTSRNAFLMSPSFAVELRHAVKLLIPMGETFIKNRLDTYLLLPEDMTDFQLRKKEAADIAEQKSREMRQQIQMNYVTMLQRGPEPCPAYLKEHLFREFGVEVDRVWDLRDRQALIYYSKPAIRNYIELSKRESDPLFVKKVVQFMSETGLLDRRFTPLFGGCGPATKELMYYTALQGVVSVGRPLFIDRSHMMLEEAKTNCWEAGVEADFEEMYLENLKRIHFRPGQNGLFWCGGTWFNNVQRISLADYYAGLFHRRRESLERPPDKGDLLVIEGYSKKDLSYYRNQLSQLFLAKGVGHGYHLDQHNFTRDGSLCHTLYYDEKSGELHCIYLLTESRGYFRKNQALLVIDSGTLHKPSFRSEMSKVGWDSDFVDGDNNKVAAVCWLGSAAGRKRGE
ncbi:TPA: hypothetical protein HA265_02010 [Candidatus Woesearchaeota archaeon]|nr:hypothetical protein [Candidatus Woesearchaeota archaeon]